MDKIKFRRTEEEFQHIANFETLRSEHKSGSFAKMVVHSFVRCMEREMTHTTKSFCMKEKRHSTGSEMRDCTVTSFILVVTHVERHHIVR